MSIGLRRFMTRSSLAFFYGCLISSLLSAPGRVLLIDDFEAPASLKNWSGDIRIVSDRASHGNKSALARFGKKANDISVRTPADWRAFDRLLFDVYSDSGQIRTATLRLYDDAGNADVRGDYYEAEGKLLFVAGWNHAEVKLAGIRTASELRRLALDRMRRISLSIERGALPCVLHLDNFRLVAGAESSDTASRASPQDAVTVIDGRWFSVRQVARPEDVPESPSVTALRTQAEHERELLEKTIHAAQVQGIETIYAERHLVTADLGLRIRPLLAWFNHDQNKREMFSYVAESCRRARIELEDLVQGIERLPEADDTQAGEPLILPLPHLKGSPIEGGFFRDDRGEPMMVLSLHSPGRLLQRFFASPQQHIESYSVGGGSRWTIDDSPVYEAFNKHPDARRVGWDGWCGHLVRDLDSMGGTKRENVVICLESPQIRQAAEEYIRRNIPKFDANPELLYNIMGYELSYICYCDRSQQMFRDWLRKQYGSLDRVNELWGTSYRQFADVVAPPVKNSRPLPGTNRSQWYDWARFNQDRFTDYLLWVKSAIRRISPSTPLAAGGSSYMLGGNTGISGIDEERIVNEVDDVIIHEGGGSTLGMDLQLALSEKKKPLADPEMSLEQGGRGAVEYLLPQFLHGKSVVQIFHWPAQPSNEFPSVIASSLAHGPGFTLENVGEVLRVALDVRRLNKEIAAFAEVPAEVAILYSQTSTLQLPPEMLSWESTPYLAELRNTYESSRYLDARVTFVTERQIRKGWLDRYKLVLVPAARNVPNDVVEEIWAYAGRGGRVLVVPESLLGDEHNRPQDYLARLGIAVKVTRRPEPASVGAMAQGYDQSFSQAVTFSGSASSPMKPSRAGWPRSMGQLEGFGVSQTFRVSGTGEVLFQFADGSPALVRVPMGNGSVYYAGSSLAERSYIHLLDALFDEAGVARAVRLRNLGDAWRIEARFAPCGGRRLLYVVNFDAVAARLRLDAPPGFFGALLELREGKRIAGTEITVPASQTRIYELH